MGSVKFKDLKAYVRYDGSGRVVAGSLVFRKKKPKNGRWSEISSNLCCNADPNPSSSTTTTTTVTPVNPTQFTRGYWYNAVNSCVTTVQDTITFYSASTQLTNGVVIFQDAALTIPVGLGFVINEAMQMKKYVVGEGGVLSEVYCQGDYWFAYNEQDACSQVYPAVSLTVATNNTTPFYPGTIIYANFASSGFYPGQIAYIKINPGFAATRSILITSSNTATVVGDLTSCPSPQVFSQNAIVGYDPTVCNGLGGTLTLYYTGSLGVGSVLYVNPELTVLYSASGYGPFVRLYFEAQNQLCLMGGNLGSVIQSYTAC